MSLRTNIVGQFRQPHGALGRLAGFIMARRPSNRLRNDWTVELLALQPSHRVLEIGCGPGLALKACAHRTPAGRVVGLDHSGVMVEQARRRLAEEIESGRVELRLGDFNETSLEAESYDRVYSLNVIQFVADIEDGFRRVHACLATRGRVATTYQPRNANPTRSGALDMAQRIEAAMLEAGFTDIRHHELPLDPVPAICVSGEKRAN